MPTPPAPFKRPRIEVLPHGKEWQTVTPDVLSVGDRILEHGMVTEIRQKLSGYLITTTSDPESFYDRYLSFRAFTKVLSD